MVPPDQRDSLEVQVLLVPLDSPDRQVTLDLLERSGLQDSQDNRDHRVHRVSQANRVLPVHKVPPDTLEQLEQPE